MSAPRTDVEERIEELNRLMRAHAGAVELLGLSDDGVVAVRFTGMCTGCELRPITMAAMVRPGLLAVPGVTRVDIIGARVSEEAERRILESLDAATLERWSRGTNFQLRVQAASRNYL